MARPIINMLHESVKTVKKLQANTNLYNSIARRFIDMFQTFPVPLYVRLAFHDAGTYDKFTQTGGPNASIFNTIEMNRTENVGFSMIKDTYLNIKTENPASSMADIIQIGGIEAVKYCGGPNMPFRFGRIDASPSEVDMDGRLPNPATKNLRAIFGHMGFSDIDIVALSGAHTLGGVRFAVPGQFTAFTTDPLVFDNTYFKMLLNGQQVPPPGTTKLISDVFLVLDPILKGYVQQFADDQNLFFTQYVKSHVKLSELGYQ